jgi:glycosyltransferase involved in cell wall biosynthesis
LGSAASLPRRRVLDRLDRGFVRNTRFATRVLANSWYSREAIVRTTGVNARVCYLGVDADFFRPDPLSASCEREVLSVGAFWPTKRHDFVVRAVATIPKQRRPPLRIIGYQARFGEREWGPVAQELRDLACALDVDLRLEKEVSDDALRAAYQRAGVVAFAPYLEPFGFVPLEAMACGAPVVGVSEGGVRETVRDGETGLLTDRDEGEFGQALDRVLGDERLATRLGARGRAVAEHCWSWEGSTNRLEAHLAWGAAAAQGAAADRCGGATA